MSDKIEINEKKKINLNFYHALVNFVISMFGTLSPMIKVKLEVRASYAK